MLLPSSGSKRLRYGC